MDGGTEIELELLVACSVSSDDSSLPRFSQLVAPAAATGVSSVKSPIDFMRASSAGVCGPAGVVLPSLT